MAQTANLTKRAAKTIDPKRNRRRQSAAMTKAREAWLRGTAERMTPWFEELGFPLPDYRLSIGFPSGGRRASAPAESWNFDDQASYTILMRPDVDAPEDILVSLAAELTLLATDAQDDERGHLYRHVATSLGLVGGKTKPRAGRRFKERIKPILNALGPPPTVRLRPVDPNVEAKQKARLIKASCPECGYLVRVARKWLDKMGNPHCPAHGAMSVEP